MAQPILTLENIHKTFEGVKVLDGISLSVMPGQFVTLLGPSGCGKTTTLRIIAGLETPDQGRVLLGGTDVTKLPPEKRAVNTVFQNYALFPHMNVQKNIAYPMTLRHVKKPEALRRVEELLSVVQLEGFGKRLPAQLSGGQRQRVAIARALACDPQLLLLDEPLGALDLQLRRQMQVELKALQQKLGITFIYITHDQEEALNMSDLIAVMNKGHFEQIGSPEEIYEHPTTRFAAQFIGQSNIIEGCVRSCDGAQAVVEVCPNNTMVVPGQFAVGERLALSVRAERIDYADQPQYGFHLSGVIKMHSYIGGVLRTTITLPTGQELLITGANPVSKYPAGCSVSVFWDPAVAAVVERGVCDEKKPG